MVVITVTDCDELMIIVVTNSFPTNLTKAGKIKKNLRSVYARFEEMITPRLTRVRQAKM